MIDWIVTTRMIGRSNGRVTLQAVRNADAPSSAAASSTSPGIALMPAYSVTITNGNEHQITCAATSPNAVHLSNVQEKPWMPRTSLTNPKFASNRKSQIVDPATAGVDHAPSA